MQLNEKLCVVRIFILILFLILSIQSWAKADDIKDFEIEGMSIGDSLLNYYSQREINEALKNPSYYKSKKYVEIFLSYEKGEFDVLQVADPSTTTTQCTTDTVAFDSPSGYDPPTLCGTISGQHCKFNP